MHAYPLMRMTLWLGVVFNAGAALALAFPASVGAWVDLPPAGSVFYSWLLAGFVALFGLAYAWLAMQAQINRPLVTLAAVGKTGVFCVALACWLLGEISIRTLVVALADLAFAAIFFCWLRVDSGRAHA